jgi:hypothetical protein
MYSYTRLGYCSRNVTYDINLTFIVRVVILRV